MPKPAGTGVEGQEHSGNSDEEPPWVWMSLHPDFNLGVRAPRRGPDEERLFFAQTRPVVPRGLASTRSEGAEALKTQKHGSPMAVFRAMDGI